jgi:hypothetical protein
MGPFTKSIRGNMYVLVIIDKFTKYLEAYAVPDVTTESFVFGLREFICRHSIPEKILSDQGSAYESKVVEQLSELLDIEKIRTSPFHPQGNGQSENSNRTIVKLLRTYIDDIKKTRKWDDYLPLFTFAYNTSTHATTGEMPFEAVYGRTPRIPLDLFVETPKSELIHDSFESYVTKVKDRIKNVFKRIEENTERRMRKSKIDYDRRVQGGKLEVGDKVYHLRVIWDRGIHKKFQRYWLGPFKVLAGFGEVNYAIGTLDGRKRKVVHANLLKKAHERPKYLKYNEIVRRGQRKDHDINRERVEEFFEQSSEE